MAYPQQPQPAGAPQPWNGPPGHVRNIGMSILIYVVTCGIYGYVWSYQVGEEIKRYSGQGMGGVVNLLLWIFVSPVMGFLLPNDIKTMYEREGEQSPVSALTGLWFFPGIFIIVGPIIWFSQVQGALNDFWGRRGGPTTPGVPWAIASSAPPPQAWGGYPPQQP